MNILKLVVPHWYGSGNHGISSGCHTLHKFLAASDYHIVNEPENNALTNDRIKNYGLVSKSLQSIKNILEAHQPKRVFTLGGDCGIELPIISYMANLYGNDMGIVWLDAHADANIPETSPSGQFHGMPVRHLCGEGNQHLCSMAFCHVNPCAIVYVGIRDLDAPEAEWIKEKNIPIINQADDLITFLNKQGFTKIFVHLDLDVIDPGEYADVACPTPEGLSVKHVVSLLTALSQKFHVAGATLTECVAQDKSNLQPIIPILDWWQEEASKGFPR